MDRHIPVNPLPDEIRKMSRDETVCKYCGVSYLILHEFKLLEEKVKAMEKKLKFYEGSIEREKILQEKLQCLNQDYKRCTATNESKTERIKTLIINLENKEAIIENLNEQAGSFHKEKGVMQRQSQLFWETLEQYKITLRKISTLLPSIKRELNSFKEEMIGFLKQWISLKKEIFLQLKAINMTRCAELTNWNQSLGECQRENLILQEEVQQLRVLSAAAKLEAEQVHASLLRENELQNRCHELQNKTHDLTEEVKTTEIKLQEATAEITHFKELLIKKSKECEYHQSEYQKLSSEIGIAKSRFTHIMTEKEQSLLACQQMCQHLKEETVEKERKEDNLKKQSKLLVSKLETIKSLLNQREEEVDMLKQERESILVSHQKKSEQLQETLRQKVLNEKNLLEKVETDRVKEQASHKEEILRLREEARMELDIEKQKHQELIEKYQKDQDELLYTKLPALLYNATDKLKVEMDALKKKLCLAENKLKENDQERAKEWQSLKKQVTQLEFQLKEERSIHHSVIDNMREEIKMKSSDLEELTLEQNQLIQNMNQLQEENALLQDTVRRECEERYELTEALAQAKEQVMEQKKLSGNLLRCSHSQCSPTFSALVGNHRCSNGTKGGSGSSGISRTTKAGPRSRYRSSLHASVPALPTLRSPPRRTSSLDESRKNILTVLKRQMSQL